ncbi:methyl-accepting chemotaxis protein [Telmatobacter bradus]|uniref:methyl-accepting chemotaxis protein n=1 Tax=Telmatobacter bradus TaxID=474953 RepID=UPI003B42CB0F
MQKIYEQSEAAYLTTIDNEQERSRYQKVHESFVSYCNLSNAALATFQSGKRDEADTQLFSKQAGSLVGDVGSGLVDVIQLNKEEHTKQLIESATYSHHAMWTSLTINIVILLTCLYSWRWLSGIILTPIRNVHHGLERLAEKDLTVQVPATNNDEIGQMAEALNQSVLSLRELLGAVSSTAHDVVLTAEDVGKSAAYTAENGQKQHLQTRQIAAASQEMRATIGEIGQNAEQTAHSSRISAEAASTGNLVMQNAADSMEHIAQTTVQVSERIQVLAKRSQEIDTVVHVIQEISEQTNLLALNAAIEAARAGEHGRGFAVVAGEVRRLAERTRSATEEITHTIKGIQEETSSTVNMVNTSRNAVQSGSEETLRAREGLQEILSASQQVESQVAMIATAASQQTSAAVSIAQSAEEIATAAEESIQSAENGKMKAQQLLNNAHNLEKLIQQFRIS